MLSHDERMKRFQKSATELGVILLPESVIEPGDMYFAARNTGVKLLTCRERDDSTNCMFPIELAYVFDIGECCKVEPKE